MALVSLPCMKTLPPPAAMYRALLDRDPASEGLFLVGVRTTGIYCRPTCPARKPRERNVVFFGSGEEARAAGFRACLKCHPESTGAPPPPAWVERLLRRVDEAGTERLTDGDLRALLVEPARARRWFRARYGLTFHAWHRSRRLGRALEALRGGAPPLGVAFAHGFESASGFHEAFTRVFGRTPGAARSGHPVLVERIDTPLGPMIAGARDEGVCLLEFADRRGLAGSLEALRRRGAALPVPGRNAHLELLARELAAYFEGRLRRFTVPLVAPGTPFQEAVWRMLRRVPYGRTMSYGALARALGRPGASRAVGRANGHNRIAILIPCHRIVEGNGSLRGYGGGLWRKQFLLELEGGKMVSLLIFPRRENEE